LLISVTSFPKITFLDFILLIKNWPVASPPGVRREIQCTAGQSTTIQSKAVSKVVQIKAVQVKSVGRAVQSKAVRKQFKSRWQSARRFKARQSARQF
jgi:hypothetical protein